MDQREGLAELAIAVVGTGRDPEALKKEFSQRYGWGDLPLNTEIIAAAPAEIKNDVSRTLRKKPSRTVSGVAPVAVMTSPWACPHGTCDFCPGGVDQGTPQSYTGREPAALRAADNDYDPSSQVQARLRQYNAGGHSTDKVDLIVMGGTFTARPRDYQESFVKGCLDALNGRPSGTLREAQDSNAGAPHRCIGLTLETRPDLFGPDGVEAAVNLGTTRVELGVQNLRDGVLESVNRCHGVAETIEATRAAKEAGLKVLYQMMPGLPGVTPEDDLEDFRRLFDDPELNPDMLKIYPTLVIEGTRLHDLWASGDYRPLDDESAIDLVARIKEIVPPWVRIQRVQRDIPAQLIAAGVRKGNLRELAQVRLNELGSSCQCIRCREVGRTQSDGSEHELVEREYAASGGRELFMSYEDEASISAYLRLRLSGPTARVREVKVLGEVVPIGRRGPGWQHGGLGTALIERAEAIAEAEGAGRVLVTSGVGVRDYYASRGYALDGMYMAKSI